jgi:hypothetical protein
LAGTCRAQGKVAARTMTGFKGHRAIALPHAKLRAVLEKYNRID